MTDFNEDIELTETKRSKKDIVDDIGFHLLKIAEETGTLARTDEEAEEVMCREQIVEHLNWVNILSALLVGREN